MTRFAASRVNDFFALTSRAALAAMVTLEYDITRYQPVLFAADSMEHLVDSTATITRMLTRLMANSSLAKAAGNRMQPCDAGCPVT